MYKQVDLEKIDKHSKFIEFIIARFNSNLSYRGSHIMQHSRTKVDQYCDILRCLNSVSKNEFIDIPRGDEYNPKTNINGYKLGEYEKFSKLCNKVQSLKYNSKNSSMSLKKIIFVDLERLGLLDRKTIKRGKENLCIPFRKCFADKVSISKEGKKLISLNNKKAREKEFAKIFKKVHSSLVENLFKLFTLYKIDRISIIEYTLIFSWVDFDSNFSIVDCANIILEYRKLSKGQKIAIENFFKNNSKAELSKKEKKYWDWGNWKNEAQSVFEILNDSSLFFFNKRTSFLSLKELFYSKIRKNFREKSYQAIKEYDSKNGIRKAQKPSESGFEHHHIIPIAWIETIKDYELIDNEKNILLISGTKHNQIPKKKNDIVKLTLEGKNLVISNSHKKIELIIGEDVYIKENLISEKIKYNEFLLKRLG